MAPPVLRGKPGSHVPLPPFVAILMCTRNGGQFLEHQLESIAKQSFQAWTVWVSDDGSQDGTLEILRRYRTSWGAHRLSIRGGPGKGFCANFLSIACDNSIDATHFAFADQDDVWEPDKLERALLWHQTVPESVPALYGTRTVLVDQEGRFLGLSPLFRRAPSFRNALVQNIAGGNTMVFNRAARSLLQLAGDTVCVVTHDWWTYLLVSGSGGRVCFDPYPSVRYRQHRLNQIGSGRTLMDRFARLRWALGGRLRGWNDAHLAAIGPVSHVLSDEARETLQKFDSARKGSGLAGALRLLDCGVYRQTLGGNLALALAAALGKI